jgi:hypothetical protein
MAENSDKSKAINDLIAWLQEHVGDGFVALDYWDADPNAIGVALQHDPKRLVYIAAYEPPSDYYVELETAPSIDSDLPYKSVGTFRSIDRERLLKIVLDHLHPDAPKLLDTQ